MHKFSRGESPIDLTKAKKKFHNQWDKTFIGSAEHAALSEFLYACQSHYCAYCEIKINKPSDGFIEHLERRSDNPERTFDWTNMFFSCNHSDSCGIFKDNSKPKMDFSLNDIIDPSTVDPQDFFAYDSEGNILPKNSNYTQQVNETIRIFNLKNSRLINIRKNIASTVAFFLEGNPSEDDINEFLLQISNKDCPSVYYYLLKRKMP